MKKVIAIVAVIAVLALAAFGYSVWSARKAASEAVEAYNAAAQKYNEEIAPYNEAAARIASANDELQTVLDRAQADLDKGEQAYEPDTAKELKEERKKAEKLLVEVPVLIDPFEMMQVSDSFNKEELAAVQQLAESSSAAVKEAAEKIPDTPEVPDYSEALKNVREKCTAYEDSVQKLKNVTCPPDSFVRERLKTINTVVQTGTVTAEDDPNGLLGKKGGYTGCVYFLDARVNRDLLPAEAFLEEEGSSGQEAESDGSGEEDEAENADAGRSGQTAEEEKPDESGTGRTAAAEEEAPASGVTAAEEAASVNGVAEAAEQPDRSRAEGTGNDIASTSGTAAEIAAESIEIDEGPIDVVMIGTAGGGAVEVYSTKEDAEARIEYLSFFDGSVMEAGYYDIEGTCVIRISKYLSRDEQKELTKQIRKALLEVRH